MILGPKNAIDLKIINIYNLERTSTLLFSLEIFNYKYMYKVLVIRMYACNCVVSCIFVRLTW